MAEHSFGKKPSRAIFSWHRYLGHDRCNALDTEGHWCRRRAAWEGGYHGDSELVGYHEGDLVSWVLVQLCDRHVSTSQMREAQKVD